MREQIAKLEIGNVYNNGNRIGGFVEVGNEVASKILSLVREEIEKVENYNIGVSFGRGFEEARQAILRALDK